MNDNDIEKLKARKKKAESLPLEELEKYIESYIDICMEINKKEHEEGNKLAAFYVADCTAKGVESIFGTVPPKIDNIICESVTNKDFEKVFALSDYFEMLKKK